jgi:secreted trypsin-like serine protease
MKFAVAALVATAAVAHASDINPLIIGGSVVAIGQKTYTVGLRNRPEDKSWCGGSLISPTHVLTAGHCDGASVISIGSHFLSGAKDGERIAVKKETRHPKYNSTTSSYDYSILELVSPSKYTPIRLLSADSETFAGLSATVIGWGRTKEIGSQSNDLMRVNVNVVADAQCKAAGLDGPPISETMFCAGGEASKDSCKGDSGGPLILENAPGDVLIGVVSWGEGCGRAGKPGVYSKVSFVKDWILSLAPTATFV